MACWVTISFERMYASVTHRGTVHRPLCPSAPYQGCSAVQAQLAPSRDNKYRPRSAGPNFSLQEISAIPKRGKPNLRICPNPHVLVIHSWWLKPSSRPETKASHRFRKLSGKEALNSLLINWRAYYSANGTSSGICTILFQSRPNPRWIQYFQEAHRSSVGLNMRIEPYIRARPTSTDQ